MVIVARAVVGLTAAASGLDFISECGRPFFPGEKALLGEFDRQRECLGLPRFSKNRPVLLAGGWRQRLAAFKVSY